MSEHDNDIVLTEGELANALQSLASWEIREGWLRRTYATPGWPHSIMLVEHDRIPGRGGLASSRFERRLRPGHGQTSDSSGERHHGKRCGTSSQDR